MLSCKCSNENKVLGTIHLWRVEGVLKFVKFVYCSFLRMVRVVGSKNWSFFVDVINGWPLKEEEVDVKEVAVLKSFIKRVYGTAANAALDLTNKSSSRHITSHYQTPVNFWAMTTKYSWISNKVLITLTSALHEIDAFYE